MLDIPKQTKQNVKKMCFLYISSFWGITEREFHIANYLQETHKMHHNSRLDMHYYSNGNSGSSSNNSSSRKNSGSSSSSFVI